jgi:hypothetical protein
MRVCDVTYYVLELGYYISKHGCSCHSWSMRLRTYGNMYKTCGQRLGDNIASSRRCAPIRSVRLQMLGDIATFGMHTSPEYSFLIDITVFYLNTNCILGCSCRDIYTYETINQALEQSNPTRTSPEQLHITNNITQIPHSTLKR